MVNFDADTQPELTSEWVMSNVNVNIVILISFLFLSLEAVNIYIHDCFVSFQPLTWH